MQELAALVKDRSKLEDVWLTLLALWILREKFEKQEDEWQMIAKKAKVYLKT